MSVELEVSSSHFVQRRADYVYLMSKIFPDKPPKFWCLAAEVISYFQNWNGWKKEHYREPWFYQPIRQIYKDLMCAHSIHKIREAIASLKEAKILLIKKNDRSVNNRNGQDKVHCYLVNSNHLNGLLADHVPQTKKSRKKSQPANAETVETASVQVETRCVGVDTYTKILSIDPSKKYSLLEREEVNFVQEEKLEDPWTVDEDELDRELLELFNSTVEIPQEQRTSGEDHFSASAEPELIKTVETKTSPSPEPRCSEVLQPDVKPLPKLKSDRPSGFRSASERDGFYQVLLELGKTQGKRSPAAWSTKIIKSVDAGEPCHYLTEYREGQQVGSCEKQEWEIAPGQVFPRFISYLTTRLKKAEMTDEQAIVTAHQQLKDVNLARSLWESCKRYIAKYSDDWEKQKQLGVQNAYVPPELLPEREVSLEQVGNAIASLQSGSVQLQAIEPAEPISTVAELEPAEEESTDPEPETVSPQWLQKTLDSSPAQALLARTLARKNGYRIEEGLVLPASGMPSIDSLRSLLSNPVTARKVEQLIAAYPEWGFWIDAAGEIHDF